MRTQFLGHQGQTGEFLDAQQQGKHGRRAGRFEGVLGHERPQTHGVRARLTYLLHEDGRQPDRPLVVHLVNAQPRCHLRITHRPRHRQRAGVGHVGDHRTEHDDTGRVEPRELLDEVGAVPSPTKIGLGAGDAHHGLLLVESLPQGGRRPRNGGLGIRHPSHGTQDLVVVVVLAVQFHRWHEVVAVDDVHDGIEGGASSVVPA